MPDPARRHVDILKARAAYAAGENVTEVLRRQLGVEGNTPAIIEAAYDLQAGSYIEAVERDERQPALYAAELAAILDGHLAPGASLLDIGTGELTTLSLVAARLASLPEPIHAFDISWSRLSLGLGFAARRMGEASARLSVFVAEIGEIPLPSKSVSVTTSSHALEPNGGTLPALMAELFRVTRDRRCCSSRPSSATATRGARGWNGSATFATSRGWPRASAARSSTQSRSATSAIR